MDTKLMNTPVTNFEALVGQARDCGLTQTFATAYEVNKALDEADCCGGSGGDCSELEAQIQALEAEVAALEAENSTLETENNTLETSNTQLESQIASIGTLSVTENGTYTPEAGILGWNNIEVNVEGKTTLANGTRLAGSTFTEVPSRYDFSDITDFTSMFSDCKNILTIPQINTSNGTDFSYMFGSCPKLNTIPQIDTSNGTDFGAMFLSCGNLITIPQLDTNKVTTFSGMFLYCYKLESVPQLDFTSAKTMDWMFYECRIITFVPELDTSNVTRMDYAFSGCIKLKAVTLTDVSKCTNFSSAFGVCYELEDLKIGGSINKNIDFKYCTKLTYESVKLILTACSNTTNTDAKTLKFEIALTDQDGELDALIATCTSKGWTISGLTLN